MRDQTWLVSTILLRITFHEWNALFPSDYFPRVVLFFNVSTWYSILYNHQLTNFLGTKVILQGLLSMQLSEPYSDHLESLSSGLKNLPFKKNLSISWKRQKFCKHGFGVSVILQPLIRSLDNFELCEGWTWH